MKDREEETPELIKNIPVGMTLLEKLTKYQPTAAEKFPITDDTDTAYFCKCCGQMKQLGRPDAPTKPKNAGERIPISMIGGVLETIEGRKGIEISEDEFLNQIKLLDMIVYEIKLLKFSIHADVVEDHNA